jgi:hypothetical protein
VRGWRPAPTAADGVDRAVKEAAGPPLGTIVVVLFTDAFLGAFAAGLVYLVCTVAIVVQFIRAVDNWNIPYTVGYGLAAAVLWVMVPGILGVLVDPVFSLLGSVLSVVAFLAVFLYPGKKLVVDEVISNW